MPKRATNPKPPSDIVVAGTVQTSTPLVDGIFGTKLGLLITFVYNRVIHKICP